MLICVVCLWCTYGKFLSLRTQTHFFTPSLSSSSRNTSVYELASIEKHHNPIHRKLANERVLYLNLLPLIGALTARNRSNASNTTDNLLAIININDTKENILHPYCPNGHSPLLYFSAAVVIDEIVNIPSVISVYIYTILHNGLTSGNLILLYQTILPPLPAMARFLT